MNGGWGKAVFLAGFSEKANGIREKPNTEILVLPYLFWMPAMFKDSKYQKT